MDREKARQILGEGATEEQITNLLNNWHIDEQTKIKELENQLNGLQEENKKHSDYDKIKKQLDDINKANMTEQEKLEQQKKEIEKNLKDSRIIVNTAKAKDLLAGLNVNDIIIAKLVSEDENETINSVNELKTMLETQKELVSKQTKESLTNVNLKPTISNVNQNENTVNSFEKFSSLSADEQEKWLAENPNGLENLN